MQYFNFKRLIDKYSSEYVYRTEEGSYVGGKWQNGTSKDVKKTGAILSFSMKKIYQSGGYLTQQDRALYSYEPLDLKGKVLFEGNEYNIEEDSYKGNEKFTGFYVYVLKWVSAFD